LKLKRRAQLPADVEDVLSELNGRGWLDDRRFARDFARARARRRYGRYRISRELRSKKVAEELIEESLAEVFPEEQDERALVRKRLERRLRGQRPPYPLKLLRSLYAGLLRAGFSSAIIRDELFARAHGKLPEGFALEEPDEET
jgi:SOS response regulatory protein OraA/RecX